MSQTQQLPHLCFYSPVVSFIFDISGLTATPSPHTSSLVVQWMQIGFYISCC
jgi:hypothetical protein